MALRYKKFKDLFADGKLQITRIFKILKDLDERIEKLEE